MKTHTPQEMAVYFEYLDELRESAVTNMYGAAPYLQRDMGVDSIQEARSILTAWQRTFDPEKTALTRAQGVTEGGE
jgi:hypothetical protein